MLEQLAPASLLAMFAVGLLGSGHCVGMCGGIATGLGFAAQGQRTGALVVAYNLGRIASYAIAGALAATLGGWGQEYLALGPVLRLAAGVILVLMGLYLADWWRALVQLEKLGAHLWRRIQPLSKRLLPVQTLPHAIALGMLWGWLPCGLVYTALAFAIAAPSPLQGAATMVAFGVGTMPAMVAGGLFSGALRRFFQAKTVRMTMALAMIAFGVWTIATSMNHQHHGAGANGNDSHQHHHHES